MAPPRDSQPSERDTTTNTRDPSLAVNKFPYLKPHQMPSAYLRPLKKHKNMEPRARAGRHHGSLYFGNDLTQALFAFGAPTHPDILNPHPDSQRYLASLPGNNQSTGRSANNSGAAAAAAPYPETVRVLDEILTDFIIEVSHEAVDHATYAGRHKVGPPDVKFALRKDKKMLGRIAAMERAGKFIAEAKKGTGDMDADGAAALGIGAGGRGGVAGIKMTVDELDVLGQLAGEEGTGKGKGRGKGRRKRKLADMDGDDDRATAAGRSGVNGEDEADDADSPAGGEASDGADDGRSRSKRARSENTT